MPTDDKDIEELLNDFQSLFKDVPVLPALPDLYIGITDQSASSIVIRTNKGDITISGSGEVSLPEGVTPSEAAQDFWKYIHVHGSQKEIKLANEVAALEKMVTELERGIAVRNDTIAKLCKELDDIKCNGNKKPDTNRFEELIEEDDGGNKGNQGSKG